MKEINRIHLAKIPYEIEIEAKDELNKYFNALKKNIEDETILDDIEIRITEILRDQGVDVALIKKADALFAHREVLRALE